MVLELRTDVGTESCAMRETTGNQGWCSQTAFLIDGGLVSGAATQFSLGRIEF
jgi:hypothetical protein